MSLCLLGSSDALAAGCRVEIFGPHGAAWSDATRELEANLAARKGPTDCAHVMPRLHVPASTIPLLGESRVGRRVGVGEATLEDFFDVREGQWRALYLDEEALDELVEQGVVPDSEADDCGTQLLLVHAERELPTERDIMTLRRVAHVPIEGARFTLADASLEAALSGDSGYGDLLDGVHGPLRDGNGVSVMLTGDGEATVWIESAPPTSLVLVELR